MRIEISSFADQGNINEERVGLKVLQQCNLKYYAVYHTEKTSNGFFNRPKHVLWFTPREVNPGDEIVLYTKKGIDNTALREGKTVHFMYWGLEESIMSPNDCLVLSEINNWSVTRFMDSEKE